MLHYELSYIEIFKNKIITHISVLARPVICFIIEFVWFYFSRSLGNKTHYINILAVPPVEVYLSEVYFKAMYFFAMFSTTPPFCSWNFSVGRWPTTLCDQLQYLADKFGSADGLTALLTLKAYSQIGSVSQLHPSLRDINWRVRIDWMVFLYEITLYVHEVVFWWWFLFICNLIFCNSSTVLNFS